MDSNQTAEPSWKKFLNFEGPSEDSRTKALRDKRRREGHGGSEYENPATAGSFQRCKMGQRASKFQFR